MAANCEREGDIVATITNVQIIQHRFPENHPNALEIRVDWMDESEAVGKCYLDLSTDYATGGVHKGERQCDIAAATFKALGVDISGGDIAALQNLIGDTVCVYGKRNDKDRLNFYLNTRKPEQALEVDAAAARIKAMFGAAPAAKLPGTEAAKAKAASLIPKQAEPGEDAELDGPNPF